MVGLIISGLKHLNPMSEKKKKELLFTFFSNKRPINKSLDPMRLAMN